MKQLILSCLAVFMCGSLLVMTGCKSYDSDIDQINDRLDDLETVVAALQAEIASGSVIESVTSTSAGIEIKLSNGQSYKITNGTNGTNGKDGKDGSVITIGENGNWFIDGVDTGKQAVGKDGKDGVDGKDGNDGKDGVNGKDGKDGVDGKDGKDGVDGKDGQDAIIWTPGEDGYWHYKDPVTGEDVKSDQKWLTKEYITAVYSNSQLQVYNVEGVDGVLTINLLTIQSIQWVPSYTTSESNCDIITGLYLVSDARGHKESESEDIKIAQHSINNLLTSFATVKFRVSPASMASKLTKDNVTAIIDEVQGVRISKADDAPYAKIMKVEDLADGQGTIAVSMVFENFVPFWMDKENADAISDDARAIKNKYITACIKVKAAQDEITSDYVNFNVQAENYLNVDPFYGYIGTDEDGNIVKHEYRTKNYKVPYNTSVSESVVPVLCGGDQFREYPGKWYVRYKSATAPKVISGDSEDIESGDAVEESYVYYPMEEIASVIGKGITVDVVKSEFDDFINFDEHHVYPYSHGKEVKEADSYLKVTQVKPVVWAEGKSHTVAFKQEMKDVNVPTSVDFDYLFSFTIDGRKGVACTESVEGSYKVSSVKGPEYAIEGTVDVPWTYNKIDEGRLTRNTTPRFEIGIYDVEPQAAETKITKFLKEGKEYPMGIYDEFGELTVAPVNAVLYLKDYKPQLRLFANSGQYKWNKEYNLELRATDDQIDYVIKAKVKFGAEPSAKTFGSTFTVNFTPDKDMTVDYKNALSMAYAAQPSCFEDQAQMEYVLNYCNEGKYGSKIARKYAVNSVALDNPQEGTEINYNYVDPEKSELASQIAASIDPLDIYSLKSNVFEEIVLTTWYGQVYTFRMSIDVVAAEDYKLIPEKSYIVNDVAQARGHIFTDDDKETYGRWLIDDVDMTNFFYVDPEMEWAKGDYTIRYAFQEGTGINKNLTILDKEIIREEAAKPALKEDVPMILNYGKFDKETSSTAYVEAQLCLPVLKNSSNNKAKYSEVHHYVQVASYQFRVQAQDPAILFTTEAINHEYLPNQKNTVNILNGINISDVEGNVWFEDGKAQFFKKDKKDVAGPKPPVEQEIGMDYAFKLASTPFGYDAYKLAKANYIKFDTENMTQKYADGTDAHLDLEVVTKQGKVGDLKDSAELTFTKTDGSLLNDVTVVIPATITYAFGTVTDQVVVVIKANK